MDVTVMITSRNRCEVLRRTLLRLSQMNPPPKEILITADGCTDETAVMVQQNFSHCQLTINSSGLGSIASRDHMLRRATGELVLSLDDDSYPLDDDFFARLPILFEAHPEASVITFPELRDGGGFANSSQSPDSEGHYVSAYANAVAAMRRSFYLKSPGFPGMFFHCYEEPDYALQSYGQKRGVWFEPSMVIRHHYTSVNRSELKNHHYNARNELWSVWIRCPLPWVFPVSFYRIVRQLLHSATQGPLWIAKEPVWWWSALKGLGRCLQLRSPIAWPTYFRWMRLARNPIHHVSDFREKFGLATEIA
ncbi:glycosyltransferase family 2 protein [Phragmitibacter flavus]|uniref:Glycosyltransferase family 2 protein n=1 Tax=Phragmitibacter flavus TaxID=2576071 RepID=A0A5R8KCB8_9BACT|nr:glycosyltransferase family 2 protein [Phragmitibacter flavus]TLD69950.1 glycosyltransferase family 2 protein [Phragmitibacter flavus]